ncbi:MAG: WxL domain-containing protein [Patulibacter minatonensis]
MTVASAANDSDVIWDPDGGGWTWAEVGSAYHGLLMATFWRRATAGDPATWHFFLQNGSGTAMAYAETVFSGADATNGPILAADEDPGAPAALTHTFPSSAGPYDGMMRFLASGARANVTQTVSAGPAVGCNQQVANASLLTASEVTGSGATPLRTVTHSASAEAILHALLIRPACSNGGLTETEPSTISFPARALTGFNGSATSTFEVDIDDERALAAGWHLSASATPFTSPAGPLPTNAAAITSVSAATTAGNCNAPAATTGLPATLGSAAVDLYNATSSTGQGPLALTFTAKLSWPAAAHIGLYTSSWAFTLASGP